MNLPDVCPNCREGFWGDPIPVGIRAFYRPPYRWYKAITIFSRKLDRQIAWECPRCHHRWRVQREFTLIEGSVASETQPAVD